VPDPNWEQELHGSAAGSRKVGPESKDPLLAHALLRAEPEPLDLDLDLELGPVGRVSPPFSTGPGKLDELGDVDRATAPPPEAMHSHVARMMAQAQLMEELDDEGDRPTPLIESERLPLLPGYGPVAKAPEPRPLTAPRGVAVRFEPDRKETPLVHVDAAAKELARAEHKGLAPPPRHSPPRGMPAVPAPRHSPPRGIPAVPAPRHSPPRGMPAVPAPRHSPPRGIPAAPVPRHSPPRGMPDLSDLPAVFSLDGLDEPVADSALAPPLPSEAAISPAVISPSLAGAPISEPAISPPFASIDPLELAAELGALSGPSAETMSAIEARIAAGDFGRALVLAESALDAHPGDPGVTRYAESCRDMLYSRYLERLGAGDHVPQLAMQRSALTGLALDHRAGFLLSCVDGVSTLEEIVDVSAMPRLDAVRILYELVQEGVIEMVAPR
jgi:hypothetical protein